MGTRHIHLLILFFALFSLCSCAENISDQHAQPAADKQMQPEPENLLRIGVSANYPPMIFLQGGKFTGVEADFARQLPDALGRPVKLKTYAWDKLIEALLYKEIDLIMSGMTVTRARQVRIAFTDPYLKTGLMTAFRLKDIKKYSSIKKIMRSNSSVGIVGNTTGEAFVRKNFPYASRIIVLHQASDAAWELKGRTIDLFVHDAPSIMWLVSENESDITGLWEPLNSEMLAWGIRKDDLELRNSLNTILKKWKEDGTLDRVLDRWLPFRS